MRDDFRFEKTLEEIRKLKITRDRDALTRPKTPAKNPIGEKEIKHLATIAKKFSQRLRDFQKMCRHHYGPKGPNAENY